MNPHSSSFASTPPWPLVDPIIDRALAEDLLGGDLTSEACVAPELQAVGTFVARTELVVAGLSVAARVFHRLDPSVSVRTLVSDATRAAPRSLLLEVRGPARTLLAGERVALNLVQRLSGVATLTRRFVDAVVDGAHTRIADTRKTTPGLRILERWAVRCGGGHNHRDSLGSAVLIKDNHLVAAGGVTAAIARARAHAPHTTRIECEVESLGQLEEALDAGAEVILLDNMDDGMVAEAIGRARARPRPPVLEASGRITLERVATLSRLGIDVISVGALTHSAPAADVALDLAL